MRNANHLGLLAPYVEELAAQGLVGIALTTSEALVHPWGGRVAQIGTNPIAVAVPASPHPFVFDMATGVVSMGKVIDHRNRGVPLEPGWAIDETASRQFDAAAARAGPIAPFGGAKGFGLGLAFELLVASLTGSALGRDVEGNARHGERLQQGRRLHLPRSARVRRRRLRGEPQPRISTRCVRAPPQDGFDSVRVPGDRARADRERRLADGAPIADSVWETLQELRTTLREQAVA